MTAFDDFGEDTVTHVAEFGNDHIFFNGADPVAWITVQDRPEQPERPEPATTGDPLW